MKKTVVLRSLLGAPLGLALGYLISIVISLILGEGEFSPTAPALVVAMGGELKAVVFQAVITMVYGMVWAGTSVIWEMENWSILRQTVTHLLITSLATLPIAYYLHWMDHSVRGVLVYFGIFFLIYLLIWLSQYSAMKKRIQQFNDRVKEKNQSAK